MQGSVPYFHNTAATIFYDPAGYVRLDWQAAAVSNEELKAIYERLLQALKHFQTLKVMTNQNQRPPVSQEAQKWLVQEWIPRATAEIGYGRCAVVEATTPLSRLSIRTIGGDVTQPLTIAYFSTVEEAAAWLTAK